MIDGKDDQRWRLKAFIYGRVFCQMNLVCLKKSVIILQNELRFKNSLKKITCDSEIFHIFLYNFPRQIFSPKKPTFSMK